MNLPHSNTSLKKLFGVIRHIETGGHPDAYNAVGSSGELGPYQITKPYFLDSLEHDPSLDGLEWEGVRDEQVAQMVILQYWDRYATKPWIAEQLCRLHHGGPSMKGTDAYWKRCERLLR